MEVSHLANAGLSAPGSKESKTSMEFKNLVPYVEAPRNNFDDFKKQKAQIHADKKNEIFVQKTKMKND